MNKYLLQSNSKIIICIIIFAIYSLALINVYAQYDTKFEINLENKKIVKLFKNVPNSPNVLAGTANVRFKKNNISENNANNVNRISFPNKDFIVIDRYLSEKNAVSTNKERFNKYSQIQQENIKKIEDQLFRTYIISFDENIDVSKFCKQIIEKYPDIECAEPYYVEEELGMPNDPLIANQNVLTTIQAFEAWDLCEGDENLFIGISDSGVNWQHEDITEEAIAINEKEIPNNGIDDDNNGFIDDYYGYNFAWRSDGEGSYGDVTNTYGGSHGTNVAGILAARTNNGKGIAGVANKCKIIPIKILSKSGGYLYAYQSMLYATIRGCKVLNCSWGSPSSYSIISQSIVDYAFACDVAIVAAAGNLGQSTTDPYCTYFPAGYFGVLGVGQLKSDDMVDYTTSILGPPARIMVQGEGNYSVNSTDNYRPLGKGSSYAAPIVSGIVAILRSYNPSISALEAVEIVRLAGENIRSINSYDEFIPVRANMLKALKLNYATMPSIILKENYFENTIGKKQEKFFKGDTAVLVLKVINVLADAKNVSVKLKELKVFDKQAYTLLNFSDNINEIKKNECYELKFKLIVNKPESMKNTYCLVEMNAPTTNGMKYNDDFKFHLFLSDNLKTLRNEKLTVSVSDNGTLGSDATENNIKRGLGFSHNKLGDFLYEAGIVATANYTKVVSTNLDTDLKSNNSFAVVKGLYGDNPNCNIIADSHAVGDNKIGIEVSIDYSFPSETSSSLKMKLKAKNISGKKISNFALGQYYDWDINNKTQNTVSYFTDFFTSIYNKELTAAEFATDEDESVFVGSVVYFDKSKYPNTYVLPQAAGIDSYAENITNKNFQIQSLTSGIKKQTQDKADISYFIGMQYLDDLKPEAEVECIICTGIEKTKELLAESLRHCLDTNSQNIIADNKNENVFTITKSNGNIIVHLEKTEIIGTIIEIYNAIGMKVAEKKLTDKTTNIDFSNYSCGAYFTRLVIDPNIWSNKNFSYSKSFIWE